MEVKASNIKNKVKLLKFTTSVLLLLGIFQLPYGYYQLLRIIVTISSGISAYKSYKSNNFILSIFFILILTLFNPILPIYFDKSIWILIDFLAGIFFGISAYKEEN